MRGRSGGGAGGGNFSFFLHDLFRHKVEFEFDIVAEHLTDSKVELVMDLALNCRHSSGLIKARFVVTPPH